MAEAVARQDAADVIEPASAGLAPLGHIEPMTIHTLACNGYDVKGLSSKPFTEEAGYSAGLVINMTRRPRKFAFADSSKVEDWNVEDPYGADQETYQRILDDIVARVNALAGRLRQQQQR
jgi:protein-tyrosine-phosphatase